MALLSSKSYAVTTITPTHTVHDCLDAWLISLPPLGKLQDCELVFSVRSHAKQKKISAKAELESLAVDAALEDKDIWSQHGYRFFFISRHYYWGDDEVHITDNEGLFLFKWLVLGDKDYFEARRYFLRNMRRKIGAAFLKEVTEL